MRILSKFTLCLLTGLYCSHTEAGSDDGSAVSSSGTGSGSSSHSEASSDKSFGCDSFSGDSFSGDSFSGIIPWQHVQRQHRSAATRSADGFVSTILSSNGDSSGSGSTNGGISAASSNTPHDTEMAVYIGVTLGVVVVVLGVGLLIFFRHRNSNISTSFGRYYDLMFRSCQKQDARHDKNASPSKEDQETDGGTKSTSTNQHQDTSEPQKTSGNLIYTTVTFTNQTESSMDAPHCVTAIKSSSKQKSTEESTIYSNI